MIAAGNKLQIVEKYIFIPGIAFFTAGIMGLARGVLAGVAVLACILLLGKSHGHVIRELGGSRCLELHPKVW